MNMRPFRQSLDADLSFAGQSAPRGIFDDRAIETVAARLKAQRRLGAPASALMCPAICSPVAALLAFSRFWSSRQELYISAHLLLF